ncbi:MAG TPA: pseudouridine synthase [Bacteroidota bacterium]
MLITCRWNGRFLLLPEQALKKIVLTSSATVRKEVLAFYKPYGILSQFSHEDGKTSLADFGPFPKRIYPVGRLDADSEGLLLLTNDNHLKTRLTNPNYGHTKTYLVQVEHIPDESDLEKLRKGVLIKGTKTRPAVVRLLKEDPDLPPRSVPIRFRKTIPTAWIEITLTEGRNRQVRHMTAAVGHPTLRLVRIRIGNLGLDGLKPGQSRKLRQEEFRLLGPLF